MLIVDIDGHPVVCGNNDYGQLGVDQRVVTQPTKLNMTANSATSKYDYSAIIDRHHEVWVCGYANTTKFVNTKVKAKFVACGFKCIYIIRLNGELAAIGNHSIGSNKSYDEFVDLGIKAKFVACGDDHVVIIDENDDLFGAGSNEDHQLGLENLEHYGLTNLGMKALSADCGKDFTAVIDLDHKLWFSGDNAWGQMADVQNTTEFTYSGVEAKAVSCCNYATLIIDMDDNLQVTGDNLNGMIGIAEVGHGECYYICGFTKLSIKAVAIISDFNSSIAITKDGEVMVCGLNDEGQLGLGHSDPVDSFTMIPDIIAGVVSRFKKTKSARK